MCRSRIAQVKEERGKVQVQKIEGNLEGMAAAQTNSATVTAVPLTCTLSLGAAAAARALLLPFSLPLLLVRAARWVEVLILPGWAAQQPVGNCTVCKARKLLAVWRTGLGGTPSLPRQMAPLSCSPRALTLSRRNMPAPISEVWQQPAGPTSGSSDSSPPLASSPPSCSSSSPSSESGAAPRASTALLALVVLRQSVETLLRPAYLAAGAPGTPDIPKAGPFSCSKILYAKRNLFPQV